LKLGPARSTGIQLAGLMLNNSKVIRDLKWRRRMRVIWRLLTDAAPQTSFAGMTP